MRSARSIYILFQVVILSTLKIKKYPPEEISEDKSTRGCPQYSQVSFFVKRSFNKNVPQ
jgi:hypothetical protein